MPKEKSNLNFQKVLAVIGIILFVAIIIVAVIWFYIDKNTPQVIEDETVKVSTSPAKQATSSAQIDETQNWKTLNNTTVGYSIKYPDDWLLNGTSSNQNCDDESIFLAPNQDLLGQCASGYGGLVYIARTTPGDNLTQQLSFHDSADYEDYQKIDLVIDGKNTVKISGTSIVNNDLVDNRGQKEIIYFVDLGDRVLILGYFQPKTVQSYAETFEKIVSTLKFN